MTFFCLLFLCQDKKRRKRCKKNTSNFHLPNISKKPVPANPPLPQPTTDKENAPCGGLTFFCLLFLCQDKKRRKRHKKNTSNFHLPNISKKPAPAKPPLPRPTTDKENAPFSSVRVVAYGIRSHSSIRKQRANISISPFLVIRKQMNHRPGLFSIYSASDMFIRGAYAIRPYPDRQKIVTILIYFSSDMSIRRAYAIRPYPDGRKIATILIRLPHSNLKIATILIH